MASPKNSSSTITSTQVQELLRTAAEKLTAREEKALRMRQGASIDKDAPLPRKAAATTEAHAELVALEAELVQRMAARAAKPATKAAAPATTTRTKEKDKIIRALRRLK